MFLCLVCWIGIWGYIIFRDSKKPANNENKKQEIANRPSDIRISKVKLGETKTFSCDVVDMPAGVIPTCTFSISNSEVATVTENGEVLGTKGGRAILKTSLSLETIKELQTKNYTLCEDCADTYDIIVVSSTDSKISLEGDATYKGVKPTLLEEQSILNGNLGSDEEEADWLASEEDYTFKINYAIESDEIYTIDKLKVFILNVNHLATVKFVEQNQNEFIYEIGFKAGKFSSGTLDVEQFYLRDTTGFSLIDFILPDGSTDTIALWHHQEK